MMQSKTLSKPTIITIKSAMITGLVTHLFGIVHYVSNYDDISMMPYGYGTGITSGRWF